MAEGSTVVPPKGFREFCQREPGECEEKATKRNVVSLTPERLAQLQQVQRLINERIAYQSDRETYGRSEYWNYPETHGDCEDYALAKRQKLVEMGWPRSSLLFAAGKLPNGEYHLVLVAVTDQGDLVLDSRAREVRHWRDIAIRWLMRQTAASERVWRSIKTRRLPKPVAGISGGSAVASH